MALRPTALWGAVMEHGLFGGAAQHGLPSKQNGPNHLGLRIIARITRAAAGVFLFAASPCTHPAAPSRCHTDTDQTDTDTAAEYDDDSMEDAATLFRDL